MTNLSADRKTIGASVTNLSGLTAQVAKLLTQGRPYLKADIAQLRRAMTILNKPKNQKVLDEVLNRLPTMLQRQTRIGTYGCWYQYYLCDFDAQDHHAEVRRQGDRRPALAPSRTSSTPTSRSTARPSRCDP